MSDAKEFLEAGLRIRALRGGETQNEFATRLGVNRKTVERWESGERLPDGQSLLALMTVCGADVNFLLTGVRSGGAGLALSAEEQTLLSYFRDASRDVRRAALGALLGATSSGSSSGAKIRDLTMHNDTPGGIQIGINAGTIHKVGKGR